MILLFFIYALFAKSAEVKQAGDSILPDGGAGGFKPAVNQTKIAEEKMEASLTLTVSLIGFIILGILSAKKYCTNNH